MTETDRKYGPIWTRNEILTEFFNPYFVFQFKKKYYADGDGDDLESKPDFFGRKKPANNRNKYGQTIIIIVIIMVEEKADNKLNGLNG